MILTPPLYTALAGDATLTAQLATHNGEPAIFTTYPVPDDSPRPYVMISGQEGDRDVGLLDRDLRDQRRLVHVIVDNDGTVGLLETIVERVRALLHRQRLTAAGVGVVLVDVINTSTQPTDSSLVGRVHEIRLRAGTA